MISEAFQMTFKQVIPDQQFKKHNIGTATQKYYGNSSRRTHLCYLDLIVKKSLLTEQSKKNKQKKHKK